MTALNKLEIIAFLIFAVLAFCYFACILSFIDSVKKKTLMGFIITFALLVIVIFFTRYFLKQLSYLEYETIQEIIQEMFCEPAKYRIPWRYL